MGLVKKPQLIKSLNFYYYLVRGVAQRLKAVFEAGKYDAVFVQRDPFPKLLLNLLRRQNPHLVYEFEDAFESTNPFLHERSFVHRALLKYQLGLFKNMVAKSSHVIAINQCVADEARPVNPNITILCEPLDLSRYRDLPPRQFGLPPVIGWIGSPSTTIFLHEAREPLRLLCEKYPDLIVRVVGAGDHLDLPGVRLERRPWKPETEVADLCSFDIGISPLSDDPFYRAHLGHKMIQYMAVGIPIVASHTEVNATVVEDDANGYLVKSDAEWVARISQLLESPELRRKLGQRGRAIVEERFALETQADIMAELLRSAAADDRRPH